MSRRKSIPRERIAAAVALGALFLGLWLAVSTRARGGHRRTGRATSADDTEAYAVDGDEAGARGPRRSSALAAAGAFDPEGDGRERDEEAGLAVDGRRDTAWRTEQYSSFFKDGVGLVLDAGRRVQRRARGRRRGRAPACVRRFASGTSLRGRSPSSRLRDR